MALKLLDLFAGAGGLSLGFELVRDCNGRQIFELYRAVEFDKYACQTLRTRYGNEKIIEGDITNLKIVKQIIEESKGQVSVVVGGIPCQSFSLIGPRSGFGRKIDKFKNDERDNLYGYFRDIVNEIKPNIIVIENVKGILSKKDNAGKKIIDKIISDFENIGYIFDNEKGEKWHILNAADFGIPQKRERVILMGIKKSWKSCKVPDIKPTHFNPASLDAKEQISKRLKPYISVFEAIGDLPEVKPRTTFTGLNKHERENIMKKNMKIDSGKEHVELDTERFQSHINGISHAGVEFFHFIKSAGYTYIDHHIARNQQFSDIELFRNMLEGETAEDFIKRSPKLAKRLIKYSMRSFKDKYRKQIANEPSTTVFAHLKKDGNRFIHPFQARTYTPREAARIQSFPDNIIFKGPMTKKFEQIGNATPPLLSKKIAETIYNEVIE